LPQCHQSHAHYGEQELIARYSMVYPRKLHYFCCQLEGRRGRRGRETAHHPSVVFEKEPLVWKAAFFASWKNETPSKG
jgi:hypothetical protein